MSTCVEDVFPWVYQGGGGGWRRVVYMYMGLCPAEQAHTRAYCGREYSPLGG